MNSPKSPEILLAYLLIVSSAFFLSFSKSSDDSILIVASSNPGKPPGSPLFPSFDFEDEDSSLFSLVAFSNLDCASSSAFLASDAFSLAILTSPLAAAFAAASEAFFALSAASCASLANS